MVNLEDSILDQMQHSEKDPSLEWKVWILVEKCVLCRIRKVIERHIEDVIIVLNSPVEDRLDPIVSIDLEEF